MASPRLPGVQQHFVRAREILGDVLCLFSPHSPTRREYCTVLAVSLSNVALKAEAEQDALIERYRHLLHGLSFPLQIVVRNQRFDMQPYLEQVRAHMPEGEPRWAELVQGQEALVEHLQTQHTLLERHCYVIVPAPPLPMGWRKRGRRTHEELLRRALQGLAQRVELIQAQLATVGLPTQRVAGEDLARLYQSMLSPERARLHPLRHSHLAAVGQFSTVAQHTHRRASTGPTRQERADLPEPNGRRSRPRPSLPPPDGLRLADLLAPASISEEPDALRIDDEYVRVLTITAFPRDVSTNGWLLPLLQLDEVMDICLHIHPQNQAAMLRMLKRRRTGHAAARAIGQQRGHSSDPTTELAATDVTQLMQGLASGEERLFEVSFLVVARAPTKAELTERCERILARLQTVLLDAVAHPATFEQALALRSVLPEVHDELRRTFTLDIASLASVYLFFSTGLTMPGGTFLGVSRSGEPVLLDPWHPSLENPHVLVTGGTGTGKSFFDKALLTRESLLRGRQGQRYIVIDPDGEREPISNSLGGTVVRLAETGGDFHLNPFDLLVPGAEVTTYLASVASYDRLAEKIQDLHSLLEMMLAGRGAVLDIPSKALLDSALYETYRRAGITADPRTHTRQPPLLRDLAMVLQSDFGGSPGTDLAARLFRYVEGSLAGLFAHQTTIPLDTHLLIWDLRDLKSEVHPLAIVLIAGSLWSQILANPSVRRILCIDEVASLLDYEEGGRFLVNLARRARKYYLELRVQTQSLAAFLANPWGSVIAANVAIKILKKQDQTSIEAVARALGLTRPEAQHLLTSGPQDALLLAGGQHMVLQLQASPQEHALFTTNPVELAERARMGQSDSREVFP